MTFFITIMVLLLQFLWKYIDDLVGKDLGFGVIAEMLMYVVASLVPMSLPLAIMLAALMTFGNLGEHFELTALKAAGISLQRLMRPLFVIAVLISVGAFFYSNNVMPYTNLKMRTLIYSIQQQRPELNIKDGTFVNLKDYTIRVKDKDPKTGLMTGFMLYDHSKNKGNDVVTVADSAYLRMTDDKKSLVLTLFNGHSYTEMPKESNRHISFTERTFPQRYDYFDRQDLCISANFELERKNEDIFKNGSEMLNMSQIVQVADSLDTLFLRKKTNYYDVLVKRNYLSKYKEDSLYKDTIVSILPDTLYSSLDDYDKKMVVERALINAKSVNSQIQNNIASYRQDVERINRYRIEWHRKIVLAVGCFVFFLIGAPLGAIIRKGGLGVPVVISVVFFILYYIVSLSTEKMARKASLSVEQGMWMATAILLPIGIFLTIKATSDSNMFKPEVYKKYIKKIFGKK